MLLGTVVAGVVRVVISEVKAQQQYRRNLKWTEEQWKDWPSEPESERPVAEEPGDIEVLRDMMYGPQEDPSGLS